MKKIFLLGSERSGSNLLRTLLGNHSQIVAPAPPHLCDNFIKHLDKYQPFKSNLSNLYSDLELYLNHDFHEWDISFNMDRITHGYDPQNFIDVLDSVFMEKAKKESKTGYFSKDNHNHKYAAGIKLRIPEAQFVYLYRDPRDQVASWMRKPVFIHTPYRAAKKWVEEQKACLALKDFYGIDAPRVKYEDLVDNPEKVISNLLEDLGLPVEEACFETDKTNKDAKKHSFWKNLDKPVMKKNYGKYKDVLKEKDVRMIENMAGKLFDTLGYERATEGEWNKGNPYFFYVNDKMNTLISRRKNKKIFTSDLKVLKDKHALLHSIFEKRK